MTEQQENGTILTTEQLALLEAIQNRLIPAQDGMPGAGRRRMSYDDRSLPQRASCPTAHRDRRPECCRGRGRPVRRPRQQKRAGATHVAFLSLTDAARDEVLRGVETAHPELFKTLLNQTYTAYYTNPAVLLILGWNPPQPEGFRYPAAV